MASSEISALQAALEHRLSPQALAHSIGVAQTAVALAAVYGADATTAELAGLAHDWDKEIGPTALLEAARAYGLAVDPVERDTPYLLHARTGARALADAFSLPPEVLAAVERHTIGDETMGDLDMIVFVADMIEPGRAFAGVDDLRESVGVVPLHLLFARAYEMSVRHLIDRRKPIHPRTVSVWNAHVARWHS